MKNYWYLFLVPIFYRTNGMPLLYCFSRFAALRQKNYTNTKTKNALFEPTNEEH